MGQVQVDRARQHHPIDRTAQVAGKGRDIVRSQVLGASQLERAIGRRARFRIFIKTVAVKARPRSERARRSVTYTCQRAIQSF